MKQLLPTLIGLGSCLAASAEPISPRLLIETPRPSEVRCSPDGKWLAITTVTADWKNNRSASEIRLLTLNGPKAAARLARGGHPRWSPDGSLLAYEREGTVWVCKTGEWNGHPLKATGTEWSNPVWAPDGQHLAVVSEVGPNRPGGDSGRLYTDLFARRWNHWASGRRQHILLTDLKGSFRDVTPGDWDAVATSGAWSSGDGFCFAPDGSALFCSAPPVRGQASDTNYDVWRVDLASLDKRNLTADNPAADLGPQVSGGKLWVLSSRRAGYESDPGRLRSLELARLDSGGGWSEGVSHPGDWRVAEDGLWCTRLEHGVTRLYHDGQVVSSDAASVHGAHSAQGHWAALQGSLSEQTRVVLDGRELLGTLPRWDAGGVERLSVPVAGAAMPMWLVKPPFYTASRRWPLVFMIHGGPQGGWGNDWSVRWNAQVWAARGYLVALPNPRGSSGEGDAFQDDVSRHWGSTPYNDLLAGLDALEARPDVDSKRVAAVGASFGGYMVNWMATHCPERFAAFVTHCGVWNLESMYGVTDELWFTDWEFGGAPWATPRPADYDQFSPHRFANALRTPHMVVHNDLDFRCPIDQGLGLYTALQLHGVPSQLLNFPDEGHWVTRPANSLRWHREIFDFLARYCPANPAP